ncbi:unnamed protein product [marine sediment metagenome]|uniref:Uncharacterized protein n=1 Tax=marine sediment metagenome TaxID=412755 RepID=X1DYM4_9ZZZZ
MICPNCGYKFDGHTCIDDKNAEFGDGDVSVCFNCGEVHQLRNGVLELIDIKDLPKDLQDLILKTNIVREMVKK